MKKRIMVLLLALTVMVVILAMTGYAKTSGAYIVAWDGTETLATDPVAAWETGEHAYIKLYGTSDAVWTMAGETLYVDLNGNDLTVTGEGSLYAFDSANDSYDATACGTVTNNGTVEIQTDATAPLNGYRYLAVTEGSGTTFHRLHMRLRAVTLRPSAAGLYYKAVFNCDSTLAGKVSRYGVILSRLNMPGADFNTEKNENIATVLIPDEEFGQSTERNSGSVFGIMKTDNTQSVNASNGDEPIYANVYIQLNTNGRIVVADTDNVGKTVQDEDFTGTAFSLHDVLDLIDQRYYTYTKDDRTRIGNFQDEWKDQGMKWSFEKIGKQTKVDNSDLVFDAGTTDAVCPVCGEKKTWKPLSADAQLALSGGDHYYLADDVTYEPFIDSGGFVKGPGKNASACLHLNGHNLTATQSTTLYGGYGVLNVMGNGNVTGGRNKANTGNAVHINNTVAGAGLNLYGGTYARSGMKGTVVAAGGAGGFINFYEGAMITPCGSTDIYIGGASSGYSKVGFYGVVVPNGKGKVVFAGNAGNGKDSTFEIVDGTIGTITMTPMDTVSITGETVIKKITMEEDAKLTVGQMADGSSIGLATQGVFSKVTDYAEANKGYFVPSNTYQNVTVRNGALHCGKDYTTGKPVTDGFCPVCEKTVTWVKLVAADTNGVMKTLDDGDHYYLESDQEFTSADTTGSYAFIKAPGTGKSACLHLNGHNITATNVKAIYGNSGVLNVMGKGLVAGYTTSADNGAAVQCNNKTEGNAINLYSGTYGQASGTSDSAYTLSVRTAGGVINVYEDAEVLGDNAIRTASKNGDAFIGLYGAKVEGTVYLAGADQTAEDIKTSGAVIDSAVINGAVRINGVNQVTLAHAPVIEYLELTKETMLTLDRLTTGADITIRTDGGFTEAHDKAAAYAAYFTPVNKAASVQAVDNVLVYSIDYLSNLTFTEGTTAYCPVCEEEKQWTELVAGDATFVLPDDGHYYLKTSQTYEGDETAFIYAPTTRDQSACLHLNGNDITATQTTAIYGSAGVLNVMGEGTVAGMHTSSNSGAAVQINNKVETNAVNLYGGIYTKYTGTGSSTAVLAAKNNGTINVYAGASVDGGTGKAIYVGTAGSRNAEVNLHGCTVTGSVATAGATGEYQCALSAENVTINGKVTIAANSAFHIGGKIVIEKLNVAEGVLLTMEDLLEGSAVTVSATGTFTAANGEADHYAPYFTTEDAGNWIICRDYTLAQEVKTLELPATEAEKTQLESLYEGRAPYHGELHNHARTGLRSDGNNTLSEWLAWMEEKRIDFATIVDHKQTMHMYLEDWDNTYFVGGSEPATVITDDKTESSTLHYNMILADAGKLEEHLKLFPEYDYYDIEGGGQGGYYSYYPNFTRAKFTQVVQSVQDHGGFFVHVHPKFDSYMISDNPLDYWFVDGTGIEITTTDSKYTMAHKDNVEAYELWVDLLERDKRVFATIGNDNHRLSEPESLTTIYSTKQDAQAFVDYARAGDTTAGPVGIRMNIGQTTMGGVTEFQDQRVVVSVGDIHELVYDESHKYGIELYDDGGILFSTEIDPTETTYFALDADADRKFYRAVVVDLTEGCRIAVGNPIWNSAFYNPEA